MAMRTRREMLMDVGKGMFVASLGASIASDLGLGPAWAAEEPGRLTFGDLEPLVGFIQETQPSALLPALISKLNTGTELKQLVAAAALANARTFGGEDYVGFHTLMALVPAYHISAETQDEKLRPLAVLKVLYRNANRIQEFGGSKNEVLHPVAAAKTENKSPTGEQLREAVRRTNLNEANQIFAGFSGKSVQNTLDQLMVMVDDATEVHRVVLVSRSWDLMDFVGRERAETLLRQSVHYCVKSERNATQAKRYQGIRDQLPKLLDQHHLLTQTNRTRKVDDEWIAKMCETIFRSSPEQAAEAIASALAEGINPESIGEAIALAANQLVLRDEGRPAGQTAANKPVGSIHGDSIGVHACDSANAWRNLARVGGRRTQVSSLILGGYQVARDRIERGGDFLKWEPYPRPAHQEKVRAVSPESLLKELDGAIREKDQVRAAALVDRIGREKPDLSPQVFSTLRTYAISEDGALHAEKYYRTVVEEFTSSRPAFRWRQLVALARVTASEFGQPAPGYDEARKLLMT